MKTPRLTLGTRILTCFGLLLATAGVLIQIGSGIKSVPYIPLSFVLLAGAAAIVWFGAKWWWTPLVAVVLALIDGVLVALASGTSDRLANPDDLYPFTGTMMQVIGLVVALVGGLVAARRGYLASERDEGRTAF